MLKAARSGWISPPSPSRLLRNNLHERFAAFALSCWVRTTVTLHFMTFKVVMLCRRSADWTIQVRSISTYSRMLLATIRARG